LPDDKYRAEKACFKAQKKGLNLRKETFLFLACQSIHRQTCQNQYTRQTQCLLMEIFSKRIQER